MNLSEYILLSREERTRHIDLSSPCVFGDWRGSKCFDFFELNDDVEVWRGRIGRNHVCSNDTQCGGPVCVNPLHWYYGTNSENMGDVEDRDRFKIGGRKNKGKEMSNEFCERRRKYMTGRTLSPETREKVAESKRGKPRPESLKQALREHMRVKWRCLVTGHVSSANGLTKFQNNRGIDTNQREKL